MKTYMQVIAAVRDGEPTTDDELKYALMALHYHQMQIHFDLARLFSSSRELPDEKAKAERRLSLHFDHVAALFDRDLERYIKGSSMEPGIAPGERTRRSSAAIADTAVKLYDTLNSLRETKKD